MSNSDTVVDEKLKPCPLCGGDAKEIGLLQYYQCSNSDCLLGDARIYREAWQAFPRVSGELAELAEEMRAKARVPAQRRGVYSSVLIRWANSIATHAEKPGEQGPGVLGPFGGHGEPPQPPSTVAAVVESIETYAHIWPTGDIRDTLNGFVAQLRESAPEPVMEQVWLCHSQAFYPTIYATVKAAKVAVELARKHKGPMDAHVAGPFPVHGAPQTEQGCDCDVALYQRHANEAAEHSMELRERAEIAEADRDAWRERATRYDMVEQERDAALEKAEAELEEWRSGKRAPERWTAEETEHLEGIKAFFDDDDCAVCESTMDELRDKLQGAYDSLREHMDMVRVERDRADKYQDRADTYRTIIATTQASINPGGATLVYANLPAEVIALKDRAGELEKACELLRKQDGPAGTDEGPCGGCEVDSRHTAECRRILVEIGGECKRGAVAHLAAQTACKACGELPNYDLYIPRSMWCDKCVDNDGNPVHRTVAQWLAENKQEQLPPHPAPNKA